MMKFPSSLRIPERFLKGFELLYTASESTVKNWSKALSQVPFGANLESVASILSDKKGNDTDGFLIAEALFSIGNLLNYRDKEQLARDLSRSYFERKRMRPDEHLEMEFAKKFTLLFKNCEGLEQTFKGYQILTEQHNNYLNARVITDIRPVFKEELSDSFESGVIVHQLRITYQSGEKRKEFFIGMDTNDIQELKAHLERALEKEEIIRSKSFPLRLLKIE